MYERRARRSGDDRSSSSCSCRSRTRSRASRRWSALDVGGTLAFWRGDPKRSCSRTSPRRGRRTSRPSRACSRRSTRARWRAWRRAAVSSAAIFDWALRARARRVREPSAGRARPARCCAGATRSPTGSCSRRCAALFGAGHATGAHRRRADRPGRARVLRRLRRAGARGLRDDRDVRRRDAQHAARGSASAPSAGRCRAPRCAIAEDGEILLRGPHVFAGYYRDEDATRETLTRDGWLRSGDLGAIDDDGFLRITGRKKDLIITSSGKNIAPTNIESALRETRWISQAVVFGDNRPYLVALLTLDPDEAPALAERARRRPPTSPRWRTTSACSPSSRRRRRGQRALRPHRADQALRDPRARPHPGRRRADADAEGQARRGHTASTRTCSSLSTDGDARARCRCGATALGAGLRTRFAGDSG